MFPFVWVDPLSFHICSVLFPSQLGSALRCWFLVVLAYPGSRGPERVKRLYVCLYVCVCLLLLYCAGAAAVVVTNGVCGYADNW